MLLTPLLARFFIKKGLHSGGGKKKFDILDFMQAAYNRAITFLMARKFIAIGTGVAGVIAGLAVCTTVRQQVVRSAEGNQSGIAGCIPRATPLDAPRREM